MIIIESAQLYVDENNEIIYLLNEGPFNLNGIGLIVAISTGPLQQFTFTEFEKNGFENIINSLKNYSSRKVLNEDEIAEDISIIRKKFDRKYNVLHVSNRQSVGQVWLTDKNNDDLKVSKEIDSEQFFSLLMKWLER